MVIMITKTVKLGALQGPLKLTGWTWYLLPCGTRKTELGEVLVQAPVQAAMKALSKKC